MYKIAIGTTSNQKIKYLKKVLDEIKLDYCIIPTYVESGVDSQPITSNDTKKGSINRAKKALRNICEADFAIGIEIGYELNKNRYSIFCWVSIVDKDNNLFSAQSNVFKLPNFHNSIIMNKESLGDKVRDYLNMQTEEFKKIWAKGIIDRSPFILSAIRSALFYYLSREEYE